MRRQVIGAALGLALAVAGSGGIGWAATKSARTKASGEGTTSASEAAIQKKLDEILANQDAILKRLDEVMEELRIVKIRATLR